MGSRKHYAPEYRARIVELVRSGRKPAELAREFEAGVDSICRWVAQSEIDEGHREGLGSDQREELRRLRRQVKTLRQERET